MDQPKARITSQMLPTAPFAGLTAAIALLSAIPAMGAAPTAVYAGGSNGVSVSTNGGANWSSLLSGVTVTALAIDPLNPEIIYAGTSMAVYKTTDGGTHWTKETNGLSSVAVLTVLQIDPANPNIIYAGSGGAAFGSGVFKSTDGGVNWTAENTGLVISSPGGIPSVQGLALDPLSPNTLYLAGVTGLQAAKTTNGAANWSTLPVPVQLTFMPAIHPVNDSIVFMAGPFGLVKSTDGGTTWTSPLNAFTQSIAIDPNTPSTMYVDATVGSNCTTTWATQSNTVYKSLDTGNTGGMTWTLVMPGTNIGAIAMAPNAVQAGFFNVFETVARAAIAVAEDFKGNPAIACGILKDSLNPIAGLVHAGLLSSGQGQALTLQIQNAEASIPCPSN
jgi:photosystem II stability/assembly factor-like uncharacterized protein